MAARPLLVLLAALAGVAVTTRLGFWQLDRAAQKLALQATIDERVRLPALDASALARTQSEATAQHQRKVHLKGAWVAGRTVFLDNRQMNGRPGFYVVTPLRLDAGDAVLVQRGWAPRNARHRSTLPLVPTPADALEVRGHIAPPPARLHEFASDQDGPIRQNLDLERYSRELGIALRPLSVVQDDDATPSTDGLQRQWPSPAVDVHKHYGYAFQWFALAALIAGLYVWFQLLRPQRTGASS